MGQERRSFGSIERRSGYFRARYIGPDRLRYESPHLFSERIDAEHWLAEVHRSISREEWRPPVKVKGRPDDLDTLAGYARHCLAERELNLELTDEALDKLVAVGFDPVYGARPLKRAIQRWIENPLAQQILAGKFMPGAVIRARVEGEEIVFA